MRPPRWKILHGDCREKLAEMPAGEVQCCVTSPPYWNLRDYGCSGQLGLESTPEAYVDHLVEVFREVRRVIREDGTVWVNLGSTYSDGAVDEDESFALRDDLSPDEVSYVLSELSRVGKE